MVIAILCLRLGSVMTLFLQKTKSSVCRSPFGAIKGGISLYLPRTLRKLWHLPFHIVLKPCGWWDVDWFWKLYPTCYLHSSGPKGTHTAGHWVTWFMLSLSPHNSKAISIFLILYMRKLRAQKTEFIYQGVSDPEVNQRVSMPSRTLLYERDKELPSGGWSSLGRVCQRVEDKCSALGKAFQKGWLIVVIKGFITSKEGCCGEALRGRS